MMIDSLHCVHSKGSEILNAFLCSEKMSAISAGTHNVIIREAKRAYTGQTASIWVCPICLGFFLADNYCLKF